MCYSIIRGKSQLPLPYDYLDDGIVYYVPRPENRILHSRVDWKHANMISYFPAEVRMLFFFIPWLESSLKHARFADGKLQVIVTSYTENTHVLANFRPGYDEKWFFNQFTISLIYTPINYLIQRATFDEQQNLIFPSCWFL